MKCPTCKELFGNRQLTFRKEKKNILASTDTDEVKNVRMEELVKSMNFKRYCCTPRFITHANLEEIIK